MNDVTAARKKGCKRGPDRRFRAGILLKTLGMVIKVRPKPESGSRPKEKTLGKMISPASMATAVLVSTTIVEWPPFFAFLGEITSIDKSCGHGHSDGEEGLPIAATAPSQVNLDASGFR